METDMNERAGGDRNGEGQKNEELIANRQRSKLGSFMWDTS